MYQYLIYGICIHSEIALYNLPQTKSSCDAIIHYGKIDMDELPSTSNDYFYSPTHTYFSTLHGNFSIRNGNEIIVDPHSDISPHDLTAYLMGWGMAYLFTQRGYSALHCTALDIHGKGILISGISGSGKSTTALSLIRKGFKYLADDIVMLNPLNSMDIVPAYPLQKVCRDISTHLDSKQLLYINEERDKFAYYNPTDYCSDHRKLHSLFILKVADIDSVQIQEMTGLNKYLRVLECLFLAEIYCHTDTPNDDRFRCLKLAEKLKVYVITRPLHGDTITEISNIIEQQITETN